MHARSSVLPCLAAAVVSLATLSFGCGTGMAAPAASAASTGSTLPPYTGHVTALFDDGIEGEAVGYSLEPGTPPQEDELLRERTRQGDCVVRARVVSVTSTHDDRGPTWRISLHPLERLAGCTAGMDDFTLEVKGEDPAAGILRVFEGRLMGVPFLAFVRTFAGSDGSTGEVHFHLAGQAQAEVDAVRVAALFSR